MKSDSNIVIPMPDLSPEAAFALTDWMSRIAHEVDMYYGDHIRSYMERCDREAAEIEEEIQRLRESGGKSQEEPPF